MTQARAAAIDTRISDREVIESHNSVEMMKRAHLWGYGGRTLPLVRGERSASTDCGFMINREGVPPFRVFLGNIFTIAAAVERGITSGKQEVPFTDYDSAEAAAAAGWEVD